MREQETIHDPERIRAMAHPLRLQLLDVLTELGEATATECAQRTGESVASCSFHLRMLAKYGYIERAEPRGREKPWRRTKLSFSATPAPDVPGSLPAAVELARLQFSHNVQLLQVALEQLDQEPEEWVQATSLSTVSFWATAEEAARLTAQITELLDQFDGRDQDPATRPEGARRVRLMTTVHAQPEQENR
jgi:DNA-binding transcriptional ArsR family regulator